MQTLVGGTVAAHLCIVYNLLVMLGLSFDVHDQDHAVTLTPLATLEPQVHWHEHPSSMDGRGSATYVWKQIRDQKYCSMGVKLQ